MASMLGCPAVFQGPAQIMGNSAEILDIRMDVQSSQTATSSSYSPPRPALLSRPHTMTTTITVAPARSAVASRRKRRGRRQPDAGDGGNDDDDGSGSGDGGSWGGGSGWESNDDEGGGNWSFGAQNLWMWQAIAVCGLLQAVQHLASEQYQADSHHSTQRIAFAQ